MNFVRGLSADMEDLTTKKGQKQAVDFWNHFCWCVEKEYFEPVHVMPVTLSYHQATVPEETADAKDGDVVIITDCTPENESLSAMIARFQAVCLKKTRIVNISEYPFKGGCLGCFNCAADGTCIYKDGFDTFLRENIQKADAMIYAFSELLDKVILFNFLEVTVCCNLDFCSCRIVAYHDACRVDLKSRDRPYVVVAALYAVLNCICLLRTKCKDHNFLRVEYCSDTN